MKLYVIALGLTDTEQEMLMGYTLDPSVAERFVEIYNENVDNTNILGSISSLDVPEGSTKESLGIADRIFTHKMMNGFEEAVDNVRN